MVKIKFFISAIAILYVVLRFCILPAHGQALPEGMIIYWQANPPTQSVEWYRVEIQEAGSDEWVEVESTNFCQSREQFTSTFGTTSPAEGMDPICSVARGLSSLPVTQPVQAGDTFCVRVSANKSNETGAFAEPLCGTVTQQTFDEVPPPVTSTLSAPAQLTLEFR